MLYVTICHDDIERNTVAWNVDAGYVGARTISRAILYVANTSRVFQSTQPEKLLHVRHVHIQFYN